MEVYVDASLKMGVVGIGVVAVKNGVKTVHKYSFRECSGSLNAESIAILKGVAIAKETDTNIEAIVKTDCLNLVEKYGGRQGGVKVQWIPRRLNIAHKYSVLAREENVECDI